MKKTITVLLSVIFSFVLGSTVFATEYLFKLKQDAAVLCSDEVFLMGEECFEDDSLLAQKIGVYKTDDMSVIEKYQKLGLLEYYEENGEAELLDMPRTSEYMSIESYVSSVTVPLGYSYSQIGADYLWSLGLTGKGVTVAVIDSGVNPHKDIVDNLLPGYNYSLSDYEINADPNAVYVTYDKYRHGTMVAGLIAANGNHYRGIAYEAKIVPLKCFRDSDGKADLDDLAKAVIDAIDKYDCDVINMSCGTITNSTTVKLAVAYANANGVPLIAAAGNKGSSSTLTDSYYYPASYDSAISVANIQKDDKLTSSSQKNDKVDVAAPGTYIYGIEANNSTGYRYNSGTSFSCPIVAGIVALMLDADNTLNDSTIQSILQQTATDLGNVGKDVKFGYGKVNCAAIVPKILDGKIYRSGIVEHRGTYNIAFRNGLEAPKKVTVYEKESSETVETKNEHLLEYGDNLKFEIPDKGLFKAAYEQNRNSELFIRNGTETSYLSMFVAANFNGSRMSKVAGTLVSADSNGGTASYSLPFFDSGITKIFEFDAETFMPLQTVITDQ